MNRLYVITLVLLLPFLASSQAQIDFEEFNLEVDSFLNGSDMNGGFQSYSHFFPNDYNPQWNSWTGWSISASRDTTTRGFTNQFACISGHGNNESKTYAISYAFDPVRIIDIDQESRAYFDLYMNNATYTYWSILEGDAVAKKFGGPSGNDPDYYYVSIHGYQNGEFMKDSVVFYLADYRFEDNSKDYVINEWTRVDLSRLNGADSLEFVTYSSDVGQFGKNTPTYFCIDDFDYGPGASTFDYRQFQDLQLSPTVTQDEVFFQEEQSGILNIIDASGRIIERKTIDRSRSISTAHLKTGKYHLILEKDGEWFQGQVVRM